MKQTIVIKVPMKGEKYRAKAMKIAAVTSGVVSVAVEGAEKERLVVIGNSVDSATLIKTLRRKVGYATLVSVQEIKDKKEIQVCGCFQAGFTYCYLCRPPSCSGSSSQYSNIPVFYCYQPAYDPNPVNCSIM